MGGLLDIWSQSDGQNCLGQYGAIMITVVLSHLILDIIMIIRKIGEGETSRSSEENVSGRYSRLTLLLEQKVLHLVFSAVVNNYIVLIRMKYMGQRCQYNPVTTIKHR